MPASHAIKETIENSPSSETITFPGGLGATGAAAFASTVGVTGVTTATGGIKVGTSENLSSGVKGIHKSSTVAVAVPTIADAEIDEVAVDVSSAFTIQPTVGDAVIALPSEALPTSAILCGAWVSATDQITVSFAAKEGGSGVTGANKNFTFLVLDLT